MKEGGIRYRPWHEVKEKECHFIERTLLFLFKIGKANVLSLCHIQLKTTSYNDVI
jgi:hypothetical protein